MLDCKIGAFAGPDIVTTRTPKDPNHPKIRRVEVYWTTVTYKTVLVYAILLAVILLGAAYVVFPSWYSNAFQRISSAVGAADPETAPLSQTQARFVNLDGKVQVKKVNSVHWMDADYRTTLDKGDLIQTGSDGVARIEFADRSYYTVKSDTLVTVEENSTGQDKPTSVAVRISTGAVDLATPHWSSPNSKAAVSVEDATALVRQNSRASVKNDPTRKESEIVVAAGAAVVQRGEDKIELAPWQKATIPAGSPIQKSNVLAPPELIEPLNLQPLIVDNPKEAPVRFAWKPVAEAVSYTLRVSATAMFTKTVKEAKVAGTSVEISGFDPGDYFWNVVAVDAKKRSSEVGSPFKFTLVAQGKSQEMVLEIEGTQLHGHVVEIIGRTEPGAALIVNGLPVPNVNIGPDGRFRHFSEPLEPGQHTIVVIGQNRRGGTAKQQVSIVIPK